MFVSYRCYLNRLNDDFLNRNEKNVKESILRIENDCVCYKILR